MKRYYIFLLQFLWAGILSAAIPLSPQNILPDILERGIEFPKQIEIEDGSSKRLQYFHHATANGGNCHDTYYIYDEFGLLKAVLPPALSAQAGNGTLDSNLADRYAYFYRHNARNELTGRKLPGAGWEEYGYDMDTNQLVWSQNAVQRANQEYMVYLYDALGRLASTQRSGSNTLTTTYTYNVRSWMTGIDNSLFCEELHYTENPYNTGNCNYSGKISAMGWKTGQVQRAYDFSYDNLSRLTGARYHEDDANGRYTTRYSYDNMGNMLTLKRNGLQDGGTYGLVDNLTYSYDGTKLQTTHKSQLPPTSTTTTFCGNLIYENGALKQMLVDGGYVTFNGATPVYHFYIQDHLGNNRVVAKVDGTVEQTNHYYPYGDLMADICTGSDIQPYKYNGKELDRMHGLDWYDYGARHYDATIGRWPTMDPLCEKYYDVSPYVYCGDNPVNAIDPDGRSIWTKIIKIGAKIGARVSRYGWKELGKTATYADAVSDITGNAKTVFDSNASTIERIGAGVSLASEVLPVSIGDIKAAGNLTKKILPNNGIAKPHGGKVHNEKIDNHINKVKNKELQIFVKIKNK